MSSASDVTEPGKDTEARNRLRTDSVLAGVRIDKLVFPAALVALIIIGCVVNENFRTLDNFRNVFTFASVGLIVALGETLVIIARAIDLAVGSMIALSGAIFAKLYIDGHSVWVCLFVTLAMGVLLGCVAHGVVITKFGVSFLIVTLGTFSIFRSLANVLLDGQSLTVDDPTLDWLANGRIGPVPVLVIQAAIIYVILLLVLRTTTYGSAVYAVGANPDAAKVAGLPVDRVLIVTFGLCAGLAAYAGVITVAQIGSAQPTAGIGVELVAIGGVLVGGTSFAGGQGGVTRTVVGVLFLAILSNLLLLVGVNSFWIGTATGLVLILAVAVDRTRRNE